MQQSWADKGKHAIGHGAGRMATAAGAAKAKATDLIPDTLAPGGDDIEAVCRAPIFAEPDDERDRTVADFFRHDGAEHDLRAGSIVVDADALLLANLLVCDTVAAAVPVSQRERVERMDNVIRQRYDELAARAGTAFDPVAVLAHLTGDWTRDTRLVALIELVDADPFAPYELKHSTKLRRAGVGRAAEAMWAGPADLAEVRKTMREAATVHGDKPITQVGKWAVGGALVVGVAGFAAAPLLGAALGSAAGLSGAAATSFGLAAFGGGSIAAGGAGMTGGLWLITGAAAATGLAGSGGGAMLYTMGRRQLRAELVKLQATYKLVLLRSQANEATAQVVVAELHADAEQLRHQLTREIELNDTNAKRVTDLQAKIETIEKAVAWMDHQDESA
ncbi:MAG: hypothetical protein ACE367_25445 [Acidimicrobiales bacterium]